MTNEQLNTALYEKMFAEQETYRAWLLSQPPEEILNHTYEYTVREDILMSMEYHDLPDAQAKALLFSPARWPMCLRIGKTKKPTIWMTSGRLSRIAPKPKFRNSQRRNRKSVNTLRAGWVLSSRSFYIAGRSFAVNLRYEKEGLKCLIFHRR